MFCGISVSKRMKYSKVINPFALAFSINLYRIALALAPFEDIIRIKFFCPIVNDRIACSAYYFHM